MKKAIIITLLLTGCGAAEAPVEPTPVMQIQPVEVDVAPVVDHRAVILSDLGLDPSEKYDAEDLAYLAREFVYKTNTWPTEDSTWIEVNDDFFPVYEAWKLGEAKFKCGGSGYTLAWMLEEIGVPARGVQLAAQTFLDGEANLDTHVTTEVFLNGKWVVQDATFNVSFECDGKPASILDLVDCDEVVSISGEDQSKHTLEAYPVPFLDFLAAYSINNPYASKLKYESVPEYPFQNWEVQ